MPVGAAPDMPRLTQPETIQIMPARAALDYAHPPPCVPIQIAPRVPPAPSPRATAPIPRQPPPMMSPKGMGAGGGRAGLLGEVHAGKGTIPACALCMQPAKRACPACKADPDFPTTYYCSSVCRRTHWFEHQGECAIGAGRTALYRAAHIARSLFLNLRKHTPTTKVLNVQSNSGVLSIALDEPKAGVLYYPFPDNLNLSKEDEATVLSFSACSSSLAYMWDIVNVLFSGKRPNTCIQ